MKDDYFYPDVIVVPPDWGETLFLKDVWPQSKVGLYAVLRSYKIFNACSVSLSVIRFSVIVNVFPIVFLNNFFA